LPPSGDWCCPNPGRKVRGRRDATIFGEFQHLCFRPSDSVGWRNCEYLPDGNERPHDRDVHLNGRFDPIHCSQVEVEHDALSADFVNLVLDGLQFSLPNTKIS
jgi:hypothetical protein